MTTNDPTNDTTNDTSPYPQPWELGQQPWRPWQIEDTEATWRSLGAIAHGPVLLAKVPGIAIGLRCLFAHPDRLTAWLVARADAAFIPGPARAQRRRGRRAVSLVGALARAS